MLKRYCDRCGFEMTRADGHYQVISHHTANGTRYPGQSRDLCTACYDAFRLFMSRDTTPERSPDAPVSVQE